MPESTSVVSTTTKKCKPFILDVMVFSPEAGFKFEVMVEKACTTEADPIWKLVFDLYKKNAEGSFDQIVHVSYRAQTPVESQNVQNMATNGVSEAQADLLVGRVFETTKEVEGPPTQEQKEAIRDAMREVVNVEV